MGFHLIQLHNGWAMAFTGAIIVMFGLAMLALVISQIHKLLFLFQKKPTSPAKSNDTSPLHPGADIIDWLNDSEAIARACRMLTAHLGEPFELPSLYKELTRSQCPHPHLTIRTLREQGLLLPADTGRFCWKPSD